MVFDQKKQLLAQLLLSLQELFHLLKIIFFKA